MTPVLIDDSEFERLKKQFAYLSTPPPAQKYDENQPRNPAGSKGGGRWVSAGGGKEYWVGEGTGRVVEGRKFTSDEGYQWHEQGPGRAWAMALPHEDAQVLSSYAGFGYTDINNLRRGQPPTKRGRIRGLTDEEYKEVDAAGLNKIIPPEGRPYRYTHNYENVPEGTPSGPGKLQAHWAVEGPLPDLERLETVTKQAAQLDDLIGNRGLVLDEDIVVERGAYLPGVTYEQLKAMQYEGPNGEPPAEWEEKGFTSTMLGEAGGRAKSYPALGKWESLYNRYPNQKLFLHQDEVGAAVRFHVTLPKGTKVASIEASRRLGRKFPRIPDPAPLPEGADPKYWTIPDFSATPTVDTTDLENKQQRSESEILLASGARFRVTKVTPGYKFDTGDPTLKPVQVVEVYMEYIGGGASEGTRH
jgi:hypothetical protein